MGGIVEEDIEPVEFLDGPFDGRVTECPLGVHDRFQATPYRFQLVAADK